MNTDKNLCYNSAVAKLCCKNGIIKAVLLNYIYNYNKYKPKEGPGSPARISLAEFAYQYRVTDDEGLWERSTIHENLQSLKEEGYLKAEKDKHGIVYTVSPQIAALLKSNQAKLVMFNLVVAYVKGIHVAIVSQFLLHTIDSSPNGIAYNLSVKAMAEVNGLSPAQIYRAIESLIEDGVIERAKPPVKTKSASRKLCLRRCKDSETGEN
jgi:DNA-binding MarR family transcriptional regulator